MLLKTNIKFGQGITEKQNEEFLKDKDRGLIVEVTPQ